MLTLSSLFVSRISKEEHDDFYQYKYDYYRQMNIWTLILSVFANTLYWISDCQLFGRIAYETILPRTFMIIPLIIFLMIKDKIKSYKIMVPISYVIIHGIMWCTIWAIYYLPIKQHANEGFIIMHLMFIAVGFCAPRKWSMLLHSALILDILVSYPINHYENIDLMLTLGIPALVAVEAMLWIMEDAMVDQYKTKKELEESVFLDQLTKVFNRNKIKEICKENSYSLKYDEANIMIMDIDFFKRVNDTHGHDAGDIILQLAADEIKRSVNSNDIVVRWGGEEFIVIVPYRPLEDTKILAETIRKRIAILETGICPISISVGVTRCIAGEDYHIAIKRADDALYYAKEHGRNRVSTYEDTF